MAPDPRKSQKKRRWKFWVLVVINIAGLIVILPLVKLTMPLVGIWWNTRSQESLRVHQQKHAPAAVSPVRAQPEAQQPRAASTDGNPALQSLTNQLGALEHLSGNDLSEMVAGHFTSTASSKANPAQFDMASAVFDSITRTNINHQGKAYYGYVVNFVDQNGNHKTNIDCFAEPDLEYERCLATLELVNRSPQLKRIYQAMAAGLAERASTNQATHASAGPAFRLETSR